jgi:hypothetical protein
MAFFYIKLLILLHKKIIDIKDIIFIFLYPVLYIIDSSEAVDITAKYIAYICNNMIKMHKMYQSLVYYHFLPLHISVGPS